MAAETARVEPAESEQEEEVEDVYEVERIIDMRVEEGDVLYRVRWKNYCSDDDTWEPEAHLEDCREVLLAFKKSMAEVKAKKEAEAKKIVVSKPLPTKSDVFDADSESESEGKDHPTEEAIKKKKKTKVREKEEEPTPKKKKKKDRRKEEFRPLPAPETDDEDEEEEERASTPPSPLKEKKTDSKKRLVDSEEEDDEHVPSKKHKKEKGKDGGKHKKEKGEEGKKKKGKKERKTETSEDEAAAPLEDDLSLSESPMDDTASTDAAVKSAEKARLDDKGKPKKGKWEVKLQGIKDLIHDKKSKKPDATQKESSLQKLKNLTSKVKEDAALHSDSSDSSTLYKKAKSKGQESTSAPPKVPSSSTSSSSSSSSVTAASSTKLKEDEVAKEEVLGQKDATGSTNLFEKFLLTCEAKDRAPRRPPVHQPATEKISSKPTKLIGKIEKISKTTKESPAQKPEPEKMEKTKQSDVSRPGQSYGFSLDSDEREAEESTAMQKPGEDSRERKERPEEAQRPGREKKTPTEDRRKRREDSEPRLFMACDDSQDPQEPPEGADKSDKGQATLNLGMDLNLDWMTLDDFQKHLNGEDEILSGPPLSPSELRDAVKSGDYMAVKLALNSKEDYNLDQEDVSGMSLSMLAAAGGQDDILRLLIKKGVRVNGRQKNGTTALMHAAEKNFLTTVAILLEAGSYVNAQTLNGETALMRACKRGNADVVRLLLEYGADCNIVSKNKTAAMYFAKLGNNLMVCDLIKDHISILSSVAEDCIRAYFESRLVLLEPVFPLACHRLCEGPDFSLEFGFKSQPQPEGSGILLFIFHANFLNEITARLCGPCSVHAVVLNDKFQLPIFLDSHFIYSFSPVPGINRLFIRLAEAPTAKVKLLICAYRVQLQ
ncbi:M-phase phosphoprotein 8 isoform X5 [Etheostoma spectabile]|uniref:M-phase phosphoprotein 8 isoform X5 n=1 Tax=Etheostoma spectabile TaxID=54343 RepID=UPI0013AFD590|nr:M-phase phosphoprotein 8 isoform X5 [Etheostoma spectabile]XP_032384900.1 M-phase phosphoprotein 8 isoform X5 [Etheostoma spectabile]